MTTAQLPSLRLGNKRYPVVLPDRRDLRLLLAAVVISILVIGVSALGFRVSVPQILAALLTAALIEVGWALHRTGKLVWPASALNTAVGIALILRVVGTDSGDYWSWRGWYLFALVAALALFSKYVVRYQGAHLFNPSNIALVVVFLLLGSSRVEPLDFWWAPIDNPWMVAAYAIIIAGGLFILSRLHFLAIPLAFWLVLAASLGLLAASGHCITARWALQPVCGSEFWWVLVISPEMLFFLFFMITDPKTVPNGRVARIAFAVCIALLCVLLIAPQTTEFGAKVALLAGLTLLSPLRRLFDRYLPEGDPERSRLSEFVSTITTTGGLDLGPSRTFRRGAIGGAVAVLIAGLIVGAGAPAREPVIAAPGNAAVDIAFAIDPATLPAVTVDERVHALNSDIDAGRAAELAAILAEDLAIEGEAMRRAEAPLLLAADTGLRLAAMRARMETSLATGEWDVARYRFETLHLTVIEGGQFADLAFEATGVVETVTYDPDGVELARATEPFAALFVMRQGAGDRWLIFDERNEVA